MTRREKQSLAPRIAIVVATGRGVSDTGVQKQHSGRLSSRGGRDIEVCGQATVASEVVWFSVPAAQQIRAPTPAAQRDWAGCMFHNFPLFCMHPRPKRKGSHRYHGPLGREARGEEGVEVLTVDQEPRLKITNLHQDARSPRHAKLERGGHRSSVWNSVLIELPERWRRMAAGQRPKRWWWWRPRVADTQQFCFLIRDR